MSKPGENCKLRVAVTCQNRLHSKFDDILADLEDQYQNEITEDEIKDEDQVDSLSEFANDRVEVIYFLQFLIPEFFEQSIR